jgi:hypothetical protein
MKQKFKITDELKNLIKSEANRIWPGGGAFVERRLIVDSLRRFWQYCDGISGNRNRNDK